MTVTSEFNPNDERIKVFLRLCDEFLTLLTSQEYSKWSLKQYRLTIDQFRAVVQRHGIEALEDPSLAEVLETTAVVSTKTAKMNAKYRFRRLVDYFTTAGLILPSRPPEVILSSREQLSREYESHLRIERGLSVATIFHCIRFYERFMTFRFGVDLGDLNAITASDIIAFLQTLNADSKAFRDKTPPTHLRNLFKFLFRSGKTNLNLANSVPRIHYPSRTNLPRSLSPEDIRRLLNSVRTDDPVGRRNYAMLLLTARLGLRAMEVTAIRLDDIDWRAGEILIRGKGKLHDRLPLPQDVGASLVEYIKDGRKGNSRTLFVRSRAPHTAFHDGQIVNVVLRKAFDKTGLKPPQKYVGSHILRHSLATDMLRNGATLAEIGDVLRHRSFTTTTLYATHDVHGLRSLAREWPSDEGEQ